MSLHFSCDKRGVDMVLAFAQQPRDLHTWCETSTGDNLAKVSSTSIRRRGERSLLHAWLQCIKAKSGLPASNAAQHQENLGQEKKHNVLGTSVVRGVAAASINSSGFSSSDSNLQI
ncbi:hypothetical protein LMH87_002736 [Akanthomyces muscarius]|uniref:Uncharacterized protein n=1 Tax=Akanthomyces muscarius TaxID=2231603 RepID=A0A9W8Q7N5_AKAMU|nr:hypothetical protein LMH87_002736 [Akanthomyces muscarius]KAJ4148257.1 hypothetical protein LMH87_002736 [Akanthomyces muscarius]